MSIRPAFERPDEAENYNKLDMNGCCYGPVVNNSAMTTHELAVEPYHE